MQKWGTPKSAVKKKASNFIGKGWIFFFKKQHTRRVTLGDFHHFYGDHGKTRENHGWFFWPFGDVGGARAFPACSTAPTDPWALIWFRDLIGFAMDTVQLLKEMGVVFEGDDAPTPHPLFLGPKFFGAELLEFFVVDLCLFPGSRAWWCNKLGYKYYLGVQWYSSMRGNFFKNHKFPS